MGAKIFHYQTPVTFIVRK